MSKIEWENHSIPRTSWADLLPNNFARRSASYRNTCGSAPTSTNAGRRKNNHRASLGAINNMRSETRVINIIPRDCIAWQTVSQQLTLQLEQKRRSGLEARRRRAILLGEERKDHISVLIDKAHDSKVRSTTVEGESPYFH
jgi:hypothetical protein